MRRLISDNDGLYVDRPIFALPVPHTWEHNSTVTLLGDAAHLGRAARREATWSGASA
ncbi:hypothetical protein [Microtetraspora malaysiensis]|uniref:hypothetical protein n=1 Tax=Microtetraspora malaysiensis TaxID=161358 RepID=UPI003D8AF008